METVEERLFPLKIRIRRQFNLFSVSQKVKIRRTEPNKAEVCHTSKPPPWLLRRELGTQIQRDRPKCPRAQQAYSKCRLTLSTDPVEEELLLGHLTGRGTGWQEVDRKRGM